MDKAAENTSVRRKEKRMLTPPRAPVRNIVAVLPPSVASPLVPVTGSLLGEVMMALAEQDPVTGWIDRMVMDRDGEQLGS